MGLGLGELGDQGMTAMKGSLLIGAAWGGSMWSQESISVLLGYRGSAAWPSLELPL